MPRTMTGRVAAFDGRYFRVECPDAPGHLSVLLLVAGQMSGAQLGDTVELSYQTTPSSGLWNVARVIWRERV